MVSPSASDKKKVIAWLKGHGVSSIKDNGDAFIVFTTVEIASRLFETSFHTFTSVKDGKNPRFFFFFQELHSAYFCGLVTGSIYIRQVDEFSIPRIVANVVQFVTGITSFPVHPRPTAHPRGADDDENGKVVPYVITQTYGLPSSWSYNSNSSVCLAEFQNDRSFSATDLSNFQTQNDLPQTPVYKIVGPYVQTEPDAESTLDVQYASGVVNSTNPVWFWTVKGWMLEFANAFLNTNVVPFVVSMSWGWTETDQCQITACAGLTSAEYVARVNVEFQKIGARGVTLLAASGDQGAPGDGDPYCLVANAPISSIFPGASPYVLSVGATMFVPQATSGPDSGAPPVCSTYDCADPTWPEVACSYPNALITSGGGFSSYSPRPSWQNTVVSAYLTNSSVTLPPSKYFNASNRGFPDVSALGHNYLIYLSDRWTIVDGTSCSTPVWGALISLWNDLLLNANKPTLGPVAPLLYQIYDQNPAAFNDITQGNNNCSESACCKYGYTTSTGWDPVTGLGTPNFNAITTYIQSNLL